MLITVVYCLKATGTDPAVDRAVQLGLRISVTDINSHVHGDCYRALFTVTEKTLGFESLLDPAPVKMPAEVARASGISPASLKRQPTFEMIWHGLIEVFEQAAATREPGTSIAYRLVSYDSTGFGDLLLLHELHRTDIDPRFPFGKAHHYTCESGDILVAAAAAREARRLVGPPLCRSDSIADLYAAAKLEAQQKQDPAAGRLLSGVPKATLESLQKIGFSYDVTHVQDASQEHACEPGAQAVADVLAELLSWSPVAENLKWVVWETRFGQYARMLLLHPVLSLHGRYAETMLLSEFFELLQSSPPDAFDDLVFGHSFSSYPPPCRRAKRYALHESVKQISQKTIVVDVENTCDPDAARDLPALLRGDDGIPNLMATPPNNLGPTDDGDSQECRKDGDHAVGGQPECAITKRIMRRKATRYNDLCCAARSARMGRTGLLLANLLQHDYASL